MVFWRGVSDQDVCVSWDAVVPWSLVGFVLESDVFSAYYLFGFTKYLRMFRASDIWDIRSTVEIELPSTLELQCDGFVFQVV